MKENEKQSPSETKKEFDSEMPLLSGLSNTKKLLLLAAMYLSAIGTMVFSGTDSVLLPKAAEQFGALDLLGGVAVELDRDYCHDASLGIFDGEKSNH